MKTILKWEHIVWCLFIAGCNHQTSQTNVDSLKANTDTQRVQAKIKGKSDAGFEPINLDTVFHQYFRGYKDTIRMDTSFDCKGKKVRIHFLHYCTNDSSLHLPARYVEDYGFKEFTTHSFQSILKASSDDSLLLDTVITKEMFKEEMHPEEKSYGALLHPVISFSSGSLTIAYSISIPLTDVGISAALEYSYDGKLTVKRNP
jgi:hypothetical protein